MDFVAYVKTLFPIEGDGYRVELAGDAVAWPEGMLIVPVRLIVFEDGQIRDMKEQHVRVLPERHANERGRAFLERAAIRAASYRPDQIELMMPYDLFRPELLDAPVEVDDLDRVLADPRAAAILDRRPEDAALLATIGSARPPSHRNAVLEMQIAERIDDPAAYAVYGDWLAERGDPRGEVIALQIAGRDTSALIETNAYELLGELAWLPANVLAIDWRYGFPSKIRFGSHEDPGDHDIAWLLRALVSAPGMAFVRTVEIAPSHGWGDFVTSTLGHSGLPPATRTLIVETPEYQRMGDVEPAYPGLGSIEELKLTSRSFALGAIDLPALRSLELITRGLTTDNLWSLREGSLPSLERLVVWLGDESIDDCDIQDDDIDWILAGEHFPKLKHLGLCGRTNTGPMIRSIIEAPIVRRLEVLDLADMSFDDDTITLINASAGKLAHLRAVHLNTRYLSRAIELPNLVPDERFIPVYE